MFKKQAFLRKQAALGDWKGKDLEECALVEQELALKNGSVRGCCMRINPPYGNQAIAITWMLHADQTYFRDPSNTSVANPLSQKRCKPNFMAILTRHL